MELRWMFEDADNKDLSQNAMEESFSGIRYLTSLIYYFYLNNKEILNFIIYKIIIKLLTLAWRTIIRYNTYERIKYFILCLFKTFL